MGDVGAQRRAKAAFAGRGQHDPEVRGPDPVIGFGACKSAHEAKACRSVPMMMVNVAESAIGRGEADGAVVLAIEVMEHRGGEDKDKNNGHSPFHALTIIPYSEDGVKPTLYTPEGPERRKK